MRAAASLVRDRRMATCDLFADADLREIATAERIIGDQYPGEFVDWAMQQSPGDWLYTGGIENAPDVVQSISQRHRLLGCDAESLRLSRDPFAVDRAIRSLVDAALLSLIHI